LIERERSSFDFILIPSSRRPPRIVPERSTNASRARSSIAFLDRIPPPVPAPRSLRTSTSVSRAFASRAPFARAVPFARDASARLLRRPRPSNATRRPTERVALETRVASRGRVDVSRAREDDSRAIDRRVEAARAVARAVGRHLSGSLCVCIFFFARGVIVFCLIDGVVFVYVEWRARGVVEAMRARTGRPARAMT